MEGPNILVTVALFGWIPLVLVLFMLLPARRAVIVATLGAWLFLPMWGFKLPGIPDFSKVSATSIGLLLGVLLFDSPRLLVYRFRLLDLPMALWVIAPSISSLVNGIGAYDAISALVAQLVMWGIPYFIARLYFTDLASLRELAIGIFVAGLIYMPLCLYEVRMSPQLHRFVYGYHPSAFTMTRRFGGYRPMVFMQHGLMLGMWMATATLTGLWLWWNGALKRLWGMDLQWLVIAMAVTTVLCRSTGSILLLALGFAVLLAARWTRSSVPMLALLALTPLYIAARLGGLGIEDTMVSISREFISVDRGNSLRFRLQNEDLLLIRAMHQPMFGWGRSGAARVRSSEGEDLAVTDGLWIITLGNYGLLGVASITAALLLPGLWLCRRFPARDWGHPALAAPLVMGVLLALYMMDNLMNAMVNPVFELMAGATVSIVYARLAPARPRQDLRAMHRLDPHAADPPAPVPPHPPLRDLPHLQ